MQKKFKIEVDCANCAAKIEDAVKKLPGVNSASVSFMAQKMVLDVDDDKFDAVLKDVVKTAKRVEPDLRSSCKLLASAFSDVSNRLKVSESIPSRRTCADAWNTLQAKKQIRVPSRHEKMLLCGRVVPKEGCRSVAQPHCGEPHLCSVELL